MAKEHHGSRGQELNPIARPFVKAGPIPTLAFQFAINSGVIAITEHLKDRGFKRWYWIPRFGVTAHGFAVQFTLFEMTK